MENITVISSGSWDDTLSIDCNDLTNNGIYILFTGYILPFLSPKVREYTKHIFISIKNAGKITGELVSMTEYGFDKIQDLSNNKEMIDFIFKICESKGHKLLTNQITELAWAFSGDTDNGKKDELKQTWKKLLNELERLSILNKMDKTTKRNKP